MHQDPSGPGVALEKSTIPEKSGFSGSFGPSGQNICVFQKMKIVNLKSCQSAAAGRCLEQGLHQAWQGGAGGGEQERQGRQESRGLPPATIFF